MLAEKENGFEASDVNSTFFLCLLSFCHLILLHYYNYDISVLAAIKRYFDSRKRLNRESKPEQKERVHLQEKQRKARARYQRVSYNIYMIIIENTNVVIIIIIMYIYFVLQLFDRRKKCVRGSEQLRWEQLSLDYEFRIQ